MRLATNFRRMSDVTGEVHDRALPFVGAIFDTIVELYHRELVARDCADSRLLDIDLRGLSQRDFDEFRAATAEAFQMKPLIFELALASARDTVGQALGASLRTLDPTTMRLDQAATAVIAAAQGGAAEVLEANFAWREIIGRR